MIWKKVKGYEDSYEVSENGIVRSIDRVVMNKTKNGKPRPCLCKGKELSPYKRKDGRLEVVLRKDGKSRTKSIHVIVAETFLKKKPKTEVNHKDGSFLNNHFLNLEWITKKENIRHAFYSEIMTTTKKVARLDEKGEIKKVYASESDACRKNGVAQGKISRAIKRNGRSCGFKWCFVDESVTTTEKWESPTK